MTTAGQHESFGHLRPFLCERLPRIMAFRDFWRQDSQVQGLGGVVRYLQQLVPGSRVSHDISGMPYHELASPFLLVNSDKVKSLDNSDLTVSLWGLRLSRLQHVQVCQAKPGHLGTDYDWRSLLDDIRFLLGGATSTTCQAQDELAELGLESLSHASGIVLGPDGVWVHDTFVLQNFAKRRERSSSSRRMIDHVPRILGSQSNSILAALVCKVGRQSSWAAQEERQQLVEKLGKRALGTLADRVMSIGLQWRSKRVAWRQQVIAMVTRFLSCSRRRKTLWLPGPLVRVILSFAYCDVQV